MDMNKLRLFRFSQKFSDKKVLSLLLMIIIFNPLSAISDNEGGRKYLKWGMTVDEVNNELQKHEQRSGRLFQVGEYDKGLPVTYAPSKYTNIYDPALKT
ncbi:MAG: hypothetical protein ACLPYB_11610 [Desulfobaccales bacterium]